MDETKKMIVVDSSRMPWEHIFNEKAGLTMLRKYLVQDPDTGMNISLRRFPAGYMTTWHYHHCAHGMYVIEGTLKTHDGCFGPGTMVWFPEGCLMEHGATAETDLTCMFITNKTFDIHFVEKDEARA